MKHKTLIALFVLVHALLLMGTAVPAAKKPTTIPELSLYRGVDRQQILEEGAKKEGKLTFYTSGAEAIRPVIEAFEKKYPFIKVETWRTSGQPLISRLLEEFKSGNHAFDTLETTQTVMLIMMASGIVQPFYSPNLAKIEDEAVLPAPDGGAYAVAFRSSGIGLGYNTKLISKEQLPKTYQDLLDPKWKGKMAIAGSDTGVGWSGAIYQTFGEEFLSKIAKQNFALHMVSAAAMANIVISGEYIASPTVLNISTIVKKPGTPIAWIPLEPVRVNVGQVAISKNAPHPHAALLLADFELSKESGEIHRTTGYDHFRTDVPPLEQRYKKYFGPRTTEEVSKELAIFNKLFVVK